MIVLDTHVLVWWVDNPDKLSKKAKTAIENALKEENILISAISILEIYRLVKAGRLVLKTHVDTWIEKIEALPFVKFIPVDNKIAALSVNLEDFDHHRDPADRIIIATALREGADLITSDSSILNYSHLKSIW